MTKQTLAVVSENEGASGGGSIVALPVALEAVEETRSRCWDGGEQDTLVRHPSSMKEGNGCNWRAQLAMARRITTVR